MQTVKSREPLRKQGSGSLRASLLKQILGNPRSQDRQTEYSGQYNISSSLHFRGMEQALRGSLGCGSEEPALEETREIGDGTLMGQMFRGLDEVPGKRFTESQFHFRRNEVGRVKPGNK